MQKIDTAKACIVAELDPARLREAIHGNIYMCAPDTRPGVARQFDENDLISLRLYGKLTKMGYTREMSGAMACMARDALQRIEEGEDARFDFVDHGFEGVRLLIVSQTDDPLPNRVHDGGMKFLVLNVHSFPLSILRQQVRERVVALNEARPQIAD